MKILSLNCQRGYQPGLEVFLHAALTEQTYDFFLLQEVDVRVLSYIQNASYKLLRVFNEEAGEDSEACILYHDTYELIKSGFQSFSSMRNDPWRGFTHPSFGFVWGDFIRDTTPIRVGSIHLHSGVDSRARYAELTKTKEHLVAAGHMSTVFAGDFNAGFPGEPDTMARLLTPEFGWASKHCGPTLDSRYSENVPHLPNRIAAFLALFNISIPLRTDHFFIDNTTAERGTFSCHVLPDRVSDHRPIELELPW